MMRSLWSGVSGLNAHQTGIDVEGNNIANVNTVGYKYSRTNFEDYMSQTTSPAISPQGKLGGKNATQIGSGASVANVQQIFSQGATQGTDKNTDMAINGEGFFIVSGNGGDSYEFSRAGNFTFDANGNLVNPNGMIVQGWLADSYYEINSTGGLSNITIDPGLTTPANATTKVSIVANLNSGTTVDESERSAARTTVKPSSDLNGLYDYKGDKLELKSNIDTLNVILKRTFDLAGTATESTSTHSFTYGESASETDGFFTTMQDLLDEINYILEDSTGIHDNKVVLTGDGQIAAAGHIVAVNSSTNPATAASTADMGALRNFDGSDASLTTGQQVQVTFDTTSGATGTATLTYGTDFTTIADLVSAVNTAGAGATSTLTYDAETGFINDDNGLLSNAVALDSTGAAPSTGSNLQNFNAILDTLGGNDSNSYTIRGTSFYSTPTTNTILAESFSKATSGYYLSRSLKENDNAFVGADDVGELFNVNGESMMVDSGDGIKVSVENLGENRNFIYRAPDAANKNSYLTNDFQDPTDVTIVDSSQGFRWMKDTSGNDAFMIKGQKIVVNFDSSATNGLTSKTYTYGTVDGFQTIDELLTKINTDLTQANITGKNVSFDSINGWIEDGGNVLLGMSAVQENGTAPTTGTPLDTLNTMLSGIDSTVNSSTAVMKKNDTYYFTDTQELMNLYQDAIDDAGSPTNYELAINGKITMDKDGRFVVSNNSSSTPFKLTTTGYPDDIDNNKQLLDNFGGLSGTVSDSPLSSLRFFAATHATSVEVYDSSGSKIQVTLNFRKDQTSSSNSDPTVWQWYAEAPEPATFVYPSFGQIEFNVDGSVKSYTPPSVNLNANTGSSSGQSIQLDLGDINGFNGITAFADDSITKNQSQDGYSGGSLVDLSVDQTGTIIGGFSNGKTFKLAQVGMATFSNNEGLLKQGGNTYTETANSGTAQIGAAGTSNRGVISPQTLEMSNVDLSQSLTNLIVIQRGFQANSKTITTSDQMLNTLLQLKQ